MTSMSVRLADLRSALASVRFAVSSDPEVPALTGVLFDFDGSMVRLVATDRHRMAVGSLPTHDQHGPATQAIAPVALFDSLGALDLGTDSEIELRFDADTITIGGVSAPVIDAPFPDYQRLLRTTSAPQITITTADLRSRLTSGGTRAVRDSPDSIERDISVLHATGDTIEVLDPDHSGGIGFNRDFLLQALDAGGSDQLVLALDGPISPLAIRDPDRSDAVSLLMPVRLAD